MYVLSTNLIYLYPHAKTTNRKPVILHSLRNKKLLCGSKPGQRVRFFLDYIFFQKCANVVYLLGLQRLVKVIDYADDINFTHDYIHLLIFVRLLRGGSKKPMLLHQCANFQPLLGVCVIH